MMSKGIIIHSNHPEPTSEVERPEINPRVDVIEKLGLRAVEILKVDLARYENLLTHAHAEALARIVIRYCGLAARLETGRWVFDLDTGCGKTLSVVAWLTALLELKLPFSVAVAASQVEALCEIKRKLVEKGVSADDIGLKHSKRYKPENAEAARRGDPAVSNGEEIQGADLVPYADPYYWAGFVLVGAPD